MPKGSDQFAVTVLNTGFRPRYLESVFGFFVVILAMFIAACCFLQIHGYQTTRREHAILFDAANKRLDSLFGLMNSPTDVRGPPGPPGPMGPPGLPGACDPVGHITTANDMADIGIITDHSLKPLKEDDVTFKPGSRELALSKLKSPVLKKFSISFFRKGLYFFAPIHHVIHRIPQTSGLSRVDGYIKASFCSAPSHSGPSYRECQNA
jgi:hypothetical protein